MARSISGIVTLEDQPHETDVVAVSVGDNPRVLNTGRSGSDGTYTINVTPWTGEVMVYAVQEYGDAWAATTAVSEGSVVHPTSPNGYVFRATNAGTTGDTEPTWPAQATTVTDGDIVFQGERLIQPVINGYVSTVEGSVDLPPYGLFQGGGDGAFFDVTEQDSLFQDVEMTIPVTADGDLVAAIRDLSGNGNHALQPDTARQATYRINNNGLNYLEFNPDLPSYSKELAIGDFYEFGAGLAISAYTVNMIYHKPTAPSSTTTEGAVLFGRRDANSTNDIYGISLGQFNRERWTIFTSTTLSNWDAPNLSIYQEPTRIFSQINTSNGLHASFARSGRRDGTNITMSKSSPVSLTIGDGSFNSGIARSGRFRFYSMIVTAGTMSLEELAELDIYHQFIMDSI